MDHMTIKPNTLNPGKPPVKKIIGNTPNKEQLEAIHHKDGPLLVLAGAGSGKTTTMASRIAHLISHHHILAENILGLSFTRKAATELRSRVVNNVRDKSGPRACRGLTISTFHALCVRILRMYAEEIGFSKNFTILDEADKTELIKSILKNLNLDDRKFDTDVIAREISSAKNKFLNPERARRYFETTKKLPEDYAIITCEVYEHYMERLKTLNSLDFDDLLFKAVELLETSEKASNYYNAKFRYILVDEYQDTNPAQFRLLNAITKKQQNLCVVGDDDQSIYAFRGADSAHILEFRNHFPGAKLITLNQNYRSKQTILDAANAVIAQNKVRHVKNLWSDKGVGELITEIVSEEDRAEAEIVAEKILELFNDNAQPRTWKDFAILFRSNPQSRLFEEALRMKKIPYKIVGMLSYLERKEVRDGLAYLKLLQNPKDDASFRRVVNYPSRSVGKTALDHLNETALSTKVSLFECAQNCGENNSIKIGTRESLVEFTKWIDLKKSEFESLPLDLPILTDFIRRLFQELQFRENIFKDTEDPKIAEKKWENVEELANAFGQMKLKNDDGTEITSPSQCLTEFLGMMTLDPKEDEKDDHGEEVEKNEVTLLTLHGSKGLEYPVVFLIGMEDGILPHQRTIDEGEDLSEERRLCYVGITRAKDKLFLTRARTRIRYGKARDRVRSRYLEDIPKDLIELQNKSNGPLDPNSKEELKEHELRVKDFMSRLREQISKK